MFKKMRKSMFVFASFAVCCTSVRPAMEVFAKEANIDMSKVRMLMLDVNNSGGISSSDGENWEFSKGDNDLMGEVCYVTGRVGDYYYILFGESSGKLVGNRDNTKQGTDNNKNDYRLSVQVGKRKTIAGMRVAAKYLSLPSTRNGVWGVQLIFPESADGAVVSSEVRYDITATLLNKESGDENIYKIAMVLVPPERIDESAILLARSAGNVINLQANSAGVTEDALKRMYNSRKRDFTIKFQNDVEIYFSRIRRQKESCKVGWEFLTCPDMEDLVHGFDSKNVMFFGSLVGTTNDSMEVTVPIEKGMGENSSELDSWKEGQKAYIYVVDEEELNNKESSSDCSNLIDFKKSKTAKIEDGRIKFRVSKNSIDPERQIYMFTTKPVSEDDFPTEEEVEVMDVADVTATKKTTTTKKASSTAAKKTTTTKKASSTAAKKTTTTKKASSTAAKKTTATKKASSTAAKKTTTTKKAATTQSSTLKRKTTK